MTQEERLLEAYQRCMANASRLSNSLQVLSSIASEVYGRDIHADLCGDYEIEFRIFSSDGYVDEKSTIYLKDILSHMNKKGGAQ